MGSGSPQARPAVHVAVGEARPDPALRLKRFREEHPDIGIGGRNPWEAEIPESGGARRWVVRYELHELLDEVERRLAASGGPGVIEREPDRED